MSTTRIHITSGPSRRKPKAGDEKIVKGVTMIRQQRRVPPGQPHSGAYIVSSGKPWCEVEWHVQPEPPNGTALYITHQPGPDVRALARRVGIPRRRVQGAVA